LIFNNKGMAKLKALTKSKIVLAALLLLTGVAQLRAQQHPNYLHAIRDLREARITLEHTPFTEPAHITAAHGAIQEINAAVDSLKRASKLDDKAIGEVPPPNKELPPIGRFHQAHQLIDDAKHDVSMPESDPAAVSHQQHALAHMQAADGYIDKVMK
jgi:hypothetical protein